MNSLGQDVGLSGGQDVASSVLTSSDIHFPHVLFGLASVLFLSFSSCTSGETYLLTVCPHRETSSLPLIRLILLLPESTSVALWLDSVFL